MTWVDTHMAELAAHQGLWTQDLKVDSNITLLTWKPTELISAKGILDLGRHHILK